MKCCRMYLHFQDNCCQICQIYFRTCLNYRLLFRSPYQTTKKNRYNLNKKNSFFFFFFVIRFFLCYMHIRFLCFCFSEKSRLKRFNSDFVHIHVLVLYETHSRLHNYFGFCTKITSDNKDSWLKL